MDFPIEPYVGVGKLKLGMSMQVIHAQLGDPVRQRSSRFSDEVTQYCGADGAQPNCLLKFMVRENVAPVTVLQQLRAIQAAAQRTVRANANRPDAIPLSKVVGHERLPPPMTAAACATAFELRPYIGAGLVHFGMTPADAAANMGPAETQSLTLANELVELRGRMNIGYTAGAIALVNRLGFGRQMSNVTYDGVSIFQGDHREVLKYLVARDGERYEYLGFIVLLRLGMTLTGFHDDDRAQRALALFAQGAWDKRVSKLRRFEIL